MTKLDSCDIIRDLLPGYIDGVLSKAGTNAVKEHLEYILPSLEHGILLAGGRDGECAR